VQERTKIALLLIWHKFELEIKLGHVVEHPVSKQHHPFFPEMVIISLIFKKKKKTVTTTRTSFINNNVHLEKLELTANQDI